MSERGRRWRQRISTLWLALLVVALDYCHRRHPLVAWAESTWPTLAPCTVSLLPPDEKRWSVTHEEASVSSGRSLRLSLVHIHMFLIKPLNIIISDFAGFMPLISNQTTAGTLNQYLSPALTAVDSHFCFTFAWYMTWMIIKDLDYWIFLHWHEAKPISITTLKSICTEWNKATTLVCYSACSALHRSNI